MASALFHFGPVQAHLLLSIHQTLHLSSFLLWLYRTLRAGPSVNCRFGQLLLGEVGWRSSKRVYAKFKVDFTSKTFLLRRRGLAMGSSYAVLLLFFSFEGAQSCYHVAAVWNQEHTKNVKKVNAAIISLELQRKASEKLLALLVVFLGILGKQINQVPRPIYKSQSDLASQAWEVAVYSLDDVTVIGEL